MIVYREVSTLSRDLEIPVKTLYAVSNSVSRHYHTVKIPKRDGGSRCLSVPDELLKKIQRAITERLLVHMPISCCATAYRYDGGILRNAAPHIGKSRLLKLDIQRFFDSVLYCAVKDAAFPPEIFSEPVRVLLTMLCYHNESLPQGAPSSPAISNLILREFDETVYTWCRQRRIAYTRYCDDMTFSGAFDERELTTFVRARLRADGFFLNEKKTWLAFAGQRQSVTGLTVNEKINIPSGNRRKLRQTLYYIRRFGIESHLKTIRIEPDITPERYLRHLLGQISFALQVLPNDTDLLRGRRWLCEQLKNSKV